MSSNKTELPTPKKKKDAAQEGQTFKSKDLVATCLILIGIEVLLNFISLDGIIDIFNDIVSVNYDVAPYEYFLLCIVAGAKILAAVLAMGILATVLPGIMQTGGQLALKALKIKFDSINPAKGIKKIFNMRTIKELVKALLYLSSFFVAAKVFWDQHYSDIIRMVYGDAKFIFLLWGRLFHSLLMILIACMLIIIIFDCLCEFFLYIKELKMDKKEIEREQKEQNGNPEVKGRRRELHQELLSESTKDSIKKSNAIIANPTHITVGIYINKDITFIPFISLIETEAKALAVRRYAKKVGVPVIEDIALARKLYATHKVHNFVDLECFSQIMDILLWLDIVEMSWLESSALPAPEEVKPPENPSPAIENSDSAPVGKTNTER